MPARTELHACPPDETLAALVEKRLSADEAAKLEAHIDSCESCHELLGSYAATYLVDPEYASTLPVGDRATELQRAAGLPVGTRVGRYVLLERVGEGASGVVYAAHDPELDRKIAIKVLHAKVDAQDRLLNEARAMAKLAHPNVVAVHDVGAFEGHVFVAMEFVAGGTLRAWMEDVHTTEEIIAAFIDAGHGLAAAHKAGLIHRDFKPENVLVGKDGRVRVTDFGLAARGRTEAGPISNAPESERNVAPGSDATLWTKAMAGTPAYMAPEQREGRVADARSDQYAYCVAFAEALHGSRPEGPRDALSPKGSTRRVPKRLSQILARGLEERPAARFPSMTSILRAIEATQSRGRRWLAFGALALLVIASFGTARVLSARSRMCADVASGMRGVWDDDTRAAAKHAFDQSGAPNANETWQRVSKTLDAYAAQWTTSRTDACEATRIRGEQSDAMLGLRMQCLDRRKGELAALSDLFSRADTDVVEHAAFAASQLGPISACDDTAALSSSLPMPEANETRSRVDALRADLDRVRALESSGKFALALEGARKDAAESKTLGYRPIEAEALHLQGVLEAESGDARAAVETLNAAAFAAEAGRHDEIAAETWIALVGVLGSLDRVSESDAAIQRAKAAAERLGKNSLATLMLHDVLGERAQEFGRSAEAVSELRVAVDLEKRALGPRHLRVARSLSKLGSALRDDGEMTEALHAYDESLAIEEDVLGPMHPNVATTVSAIGVTLSRLGRYDEARAKYERALSIRERVLGEDHPLVGETLASLVVAMRWSGAAAEALPLAERAARLEEKALGSDNDMTAGAINNVGYIQEALGHLPEARAAYERAVAIREKIFGPNAASVSVSLGNLARVVLAQGDAKAALAMYERAQKIDDATLKPDHPSRAYTLVGLGNAHLALGDANAAIPLLERALTLRETSHAAPRLVAESRFALARALASRDRPRALALAKQAQSDYAPLGPTFDKERAEVDAFLK
jgi:serine/threonine protein kinase/tetratricopeptide (TPR) repeat protein